MQAQDVTRRVIFYVPGFDPFPCAATENCIAQKRSGKLPWQGIRFLNFHLILLWARIGL